jgi:membrane protease YdiL (CAAX protease family)
LFLPSLFLLFVERLHEGRALRHKTTVGIREVLRAAHNEGLQDSGHGAAASARSCGSAEQLSMSLAKLIIYTVLDLGLAVLIGTGLASALLIFANGFDDRQAQDLTYCHGLHSLGVPYTAPGLHEKYERASNEWNYHLYLDCRTTPADDAALMEWLRTHVDLGIDQVRRYRIDHPSQQTAVRMDIGLVGPEGHELPEVPWEQLGYRAAEGENPYSMVHAPFVLGMPPPAVFVLIYLGCLQIGLVVVGLVRWWRNRRVASEPPPRGEGHALPAAIGLAVVLTGLFWLYLQAVRAILGPGHGLAGYWSTIPSIGWMMPLGKQGVMMTVQPPFLQLVAAVAIVLGAPLAQALFFRGGMLGMWTAAQRFRTGVVLSALASAVLLLDWIFLPVTIVMGLVLAWFYRWSRSLPVVLLTHILLNAALLCMAYGLIPSLPNQADQLCGQWQGVAESTKVITNQTPDGGMTIVTQFPAPPNIEFLRGGTVKGGRLEKRGNTDKGVARGVRLTPVWYEWVDKEHIDVSWERWDRLNRTITITLEIVRYKVSVDWSELTMTGEGNDQVFRYRRAQSE